MAAIITNKFRLHNAKQIIESFSEAVDTKMYLFIGGVTPWTDDLNPPIPTDTVFNTEYSHWNDMISAKRINANDVSHVIPRTNWSSGTVYDEFDDKVANMLEQNFYVMNSSYFVYKCISNGGGSASTVEPIGSSTSVFETNDGYKWKFMYEISGADALKFVTPTHIPVKTLASDDGTTQWDVQSAAVDGSIQNIKVTAGGSAYIQNASATIATSANTSTFTISVSGSGASANTGFYTGATVYVDGGTGIGQLETISDYAVAGDVATITLSTDLNTALVGGDSTIKILPTISIVGNGSNIKAYPIVTAGVIDSIQVTNIGQDYTTATASVVVSSTAIAAGATGSGATLRPILSPKNGHGSDAVAELGGYFVMLNTRLQYNENDDFTVVNDFRKIGLIIDPLQNDSNPASASTYDQSKKITVSNVATAFQVDEIVTGGTSGTTGYVVDMNNTTGVVRIVNVSGTFQNGETLTGGTSAESSTISSIVDGDLLENSGNIIYIENRPPIVRAVDQIEDIKLIIQF